MAIISNLNGKLDLAFGKSLAPINMAILAEIESFEEMSLIGDVFSKKPSQEYAYSATYMTAGDKFQDVGELGTPPTTDQVCGYQKIVLNDKEWKLEKQLSLTTIADSKKQFQLEQFGKSFGKEYGRTREEFAAAFIDGSVNATTFTYSGKSYDCTSADGVSLFSTAHTSKTGNYSNQSNLFNASLTYENLFKIEKAMQNFRDDNGNRLGISPNIILVPNKARSIQRALEIVGTTTGRPETTNNGLNINCGRFTIKAWNYLNGVTSETDDTWYLIDGNRNEEDGLLWIDREELTIEMDRDIRRHAVYYVGRARFTAAANNWRSIVACYPNASSVGTSMASL